MMTHPCLMAYALALVLATVGACDSYEAPPQEPTAFAVCPSGLAPTFASIQANLFDRSCGTGGANCHSTEGAVFSGGLDLQHDAYVQLLGIDGRGAPANNIEGSATGLVRVVPGDPDVSFLATKLATTTGNDPAFGSGMPFGAPGAVCPATLAVIRDWIARGAPP